MERRQKVTLRMLLTVIKELLIILALYGAGEGIAFALKTSFPGSVIGMLLLLGALHLKWIRVNDIRIVASFLLGYMPLFFIPAGVSVVAGYTLMEGFYLQIISLTLVSTLLVMALTGVLVQYLVKREKP
jgi:holin-like protein